MHKCLSNDSLGPLYARLYLDSYNESFVSVYLSVVEISFAFIILPVQIFRENSNCEYFLTLTENFTTNDILICESLAYIFYAT